MPAKVRSACAILASTTLMLVVIASGGGAPDISLLDAVDQKARTFIQGRAYVKEFIRNRSGKTKA